MGIQQIFMADGPYGPDREATGGTITTYGGYTIHTFKTSGSFVIDSGGPFDVQYVCVAGGGSGGGKDNGGGGGAGQYLTGTVDCPTSPVTVTIGSGGAAVSGGNNGNEGADGGLSGALTVPVTGGGGGAGPGNPAGDGGSGGGGHYPGGTGG